MKLKEKHYRWIGIPVLALALMFLVDGKRDGGFIKEFVLLTIMVAFYWNGAFMIFIYFRKKFPLIRQTPRRVLITLLVLSLFLLIGSPVICLLLGHMTFSQLTDPAIVFGYTHINFIAALFVGSIYENVYFFQQWRETIQLNEALKNQQIRTQFEVLQNQMSPHFLFNSLNTLTTLISEDMKLATEFTEKLSEVYRYILANKEKDLVHLKEELEFADNYLYLLKMRYPRNLVATFSVDDKYLTQYIAPLTIQMLIENAIKHNVISKAHPLFIDVYVENGRAIVVKNNLQEKKVLDKSTKTGLANIIKRYQYFGSKNIDIITTAKNYLVSVPLIHLVNEKGHPVVPKL